MRKKTTNPRGNTKKMNSLTTPLLCDNMQNQNRLTSGTFELAEVHYSPPRLDMFDDMPPPQYKHAEDDTMPPPTYVNSEVADLPPPTYEDAENMAGGLRYGVSLLDLVVCIGEPVVTEEHESSSTNKDSIIDDGDDTEDESEEEDDDDDPIVIVEHKVRKQDTLQGLALRYHTKVRLLKQNNIFPCSAFWMVPDGIMKIPVKKSLLEQIAFPEVKKMTAEEFAQSELCEKQSKIRQFMRLTELKRAEAMTYLELHGFHLRNALCALDADTKWENRSKHVGLR